VNFVKAYLKGIQVIASAVASAATRVFQAAWNTIKAGASAVSSAVKAAFERVKAAVTAVATAIKSKLSAAFDAVKSAARTAGAAIAKPFDAVKNAVNQVISAVENLIGKLRNIKVPKLSFPKIPSVFTQSTSAGTLTRAGTTAGLLAAPGGHTIGTTGGLSGAGVTINVNGALDPEAVARQIERILGAGVRRRSGVTMRARAGGTAATVGR
jgi:hypothetical protein